MGIESLARPEIVAMKPYSSARKEAPGQGILLNANESPWSLLEPDLDGTEPLPGSAAAELVSRLAICTASLKKACWSRAAATKASTC